MPLQKQPVNINFGRGLDTKTDPFQISIGNFAAIDNSVFTTANRLTKRSGLTNSFGSPGDNFARYITTYRQNIVQIGSQLQELNPSSNTFEVQRSDGGVWAGLGTSVTSVIKNNAGQYSCDMATATSGLRCIVYCQSTNKSTYTFQYAIVNSNGDLLTTSDYLGFTFGTATVSAGVFNPSLPRVYYFNNLFVILYYETSGNLKYFTINPSSYSVTPTPVTIATDMGLLDMDAAIDASSSRLYIAYGTTVSGTTKVFYLDSSFTKSSVTSEAGTKNNYISVCIDTVVSPHIIYITGTNGNTTATTFSVNASLTIVLAPVTVTAPGSTVISYAVNGTLSVAVGNFNPFSNSPISDVNGNISILSAYAIASGSASAVLTYYGYIPASKFFTDGSNFYFLSYYASSFQPTYFLTKWTSNGTLAGHPQIIGKLAYGNAISSATQVFTFNPIQSLPNVFVASNGNNFSIPYLISDQFLPLSTTSTTSVGGVFALAGINIVTYTEFSSIRAQEMGGNLVISGSFVSSYDGYQLRELQPQVYPEKCGISTSTSGGSITADTYYYVSCFAITDNQGNVHRSAPSIPSNPITTTGSTSTNTVQASCYWVGSESITASAVDQARIELYRYSITQPIYYLVTSITNPLVNNPAAEFVTFTDTFSNTSIAGSNILYTTGGVIENISPPPSNIFASYRSRLFMVDAEDPNLLWFSKQVIENTPVEMSDLLTIFIPPNFAGQQDVGPITALATMDDKLIIFKQNAIFYLVGDGPDNTGASSDFTNPVFVSAAVGCTNQDSIATTPIGLMFQTNKGIWLLGRDLSTSYIGAPVESYNGITITSSQVVPNTTQVRFTLASGSQKFIVYDYFYNQWSTFSNNLFSSVYSATVYNNLYVCLTSVAGNIEPLIETPGVYSDVLSSTIPMSFQTGWINFGGTTQSGGYAISLQGYERAYFFYLMGKYLSSHQLKIQIAYDYDSTIVQTTTITPDATNPIENWRIFFARQKCEAFQLTITELITTPGAGLTLSGLNLMIGMKSGYPRLKAASQAG